MHDIKWIRENPDAFDRGLQRRGRAPEAAKLLSLDERRRAAIGKLEAAQARRRAASKEFDQAKKKGDEARGQVLMAEVAELKNAIGKMEGDVVALQRELHFGSRTGLGAGLATLPNLP